MKKSADVPDVRSAEEVPHLAAHHIFMCTWVKHSIWSIIVLCCLLALASDLSAQEAHHIRAEHLMDVSADFDQPTEVAIGREGKIFVLDGVNSKVKIFSNGGSFLKAFGTMGGGAGELKYPVGMDLDGNDTVYVADTGNQRIQVFNENGRYVRTIDLARWKARPVDVLVSAKAQHIYVSDTKNHQILAFKSDGTFDFSWGRYGEGLGEFRFPGMMVCDAERRVFVVDILNTRAQVFSPLGKEARQLGEWGILPGQLFRPKGIAIDPRSNVYVSDSYTGIIQVFGTTGNLYGVVSQKDGTPLRLVTPVGMAFDREGKLYVVQMEANKVSVFRIQEP